MRSVEWIVEKRAEEKTDKVWQRIRSPRPRRAAGGYVITADAPRPSTNVMEDTIIEVVDRDSFQQARMTLPPRYRFRDLLLGDFAFNDDGER